MTTNRERAEKAAREWLDWLDSQEFYELMQAYRRPAIFEQSKVVIAFEAIKMAIMKQRDIIERAGEGEHDPSTCPTMRALVGFTVGGSEYIGDVARCVEDIRQAARTELMVSLRLEALRSSAVQGEDGKDS